MSPGKRGSGITFESQCPTNVLPANWQQAIKNELVSLNLPGVLIGAPITGIHCVLVGSIANLAHSGSEDFRKSTRRALRQGLMTLKEKGGCQILEPLDNFKLTIPQENLGQAIGDLQRMNGEVKSTININGMLLLTGVVPTNKFQNYSKQLRAYTHSQGYLECQTIGYQPSHQQTALIADTDYDATADQDYPINSLFCINKVNTEINWKDVPNYSYYPAGKLAQ